MIQDQSGKIYYGYYPGSDTLFNSDAFLTLNVDLFEITDGLDFFVEYSTLLEMAEQKGKVVLDPAFVTYSLIGGFRYSGNLYYSIYLDHYCRHIIDRDLEEGKAVFNAENYTISNVEFPFERYSEEFYFRLRYIFYPQGIIVDWLNSRQYYRHRFLLDISNNLTDYAELSLSTEYTISNEEPRNTYYEVKPGISFFYENGDRYLTFFVYYYLFSKRPLKSPANLFFTGIGFEF